MSCTENLSESVGLRLSGTRCRICLLSDEEAKKKMVSNICNCKGASGHVHVECLEMWISSSNRDHCEVCLEKIYIEKIPKFGVLRSIPIFLLSSRISQFFIVMVLVGIAIYTSSMWYIEKLSSKRDSNVHKVITFIANLSIFGSVFIISYSPLLCLYVWDLWKEWRKTQYRLRIRPRVITIFAEITPIVISYFDRVLKNDRYYGNEVLEGTYIGSIILRLIRDYIDL